MGKKTKGGNRHKKAKMANDQNEKQNMVYKESGEEYAIVEKMLGGGRCQITLPDQSTILAIIRGKLRRRRTWISTGDLVLVAIREFQDDKCDIIHKYTPGQLQILKKKNSISDIFMSKVNKSETTEAGEVEKYHDIEFKEEDSESDSEGERPVVKPVANLGNDSDNESTSSEKSDGAFSFDFDEI